MLPRHRLRTRARCWPERPDSPSGSFFLRAAPFAVSGAPRCVVCRWRLCRRFPLRRTKRRLTHGAEKRRDKTKARSLVGKRTPLTCCFLRLLELLLQAATAKHQTSRLFVQKKDAFRARARRAGARRALSVAGALSLRLRAVAPLFPRDLHGDRAGQRYAAGEKRDAQRNLRQGRIARRGECGGVRRCLLGVGRAWQGLGRVGLRLRLRCWSFGFRSGR